MRRALRDAQLQEIEAILRSLDRQARSRRWGWAIVLALGAGIAVSIVLDGFSLLAAVALGTAALAVVALAAEARNDKRMREWLRCIRCGIEAVPVEDPQEDEE